MQLKTEKMIATKDGAIGWMIFNNPARHNALAMEMWQAIPGIIADYVADPAIRAIILAGAGDQAFISGADISQFESQRASAEQVAEYDATSARAHAALIGSPKPTIAMIKGFCIGGGLGVALGCDIRIAADDAQFAIPAARLGLGYQYSGVRRLVDLVGPSFAKEIFYTARRFNAQEALAMGLVNRVVPRAELDTFVRKYAGMIGDNAPLTMGAVKICVDEAVKDPDQRDLKKAKDAVDACFASEDYKEGRRAFMEKRRPKFQGR